MSHHATATLSQHPVFPTSPPIVTNYSILTFARPPILKRMSVPQKSWQPPQKRKLKYCEPLERIHFDLVGAHASYGVPIALVTNQGCHQPVAAMVQGAEDLVCEGLDTLIFRILWPGYEHVDWNRHLSLPAGQITRGKLMEHIIDYLFAYFTTMSATPVNASRKVWTIGYNPGQWSMENIILCGVYPVHGNVFQADLQLCFPHQAKVDRGDGQDRLT
ncbi:hypothetical protein EUX98_g7511 [Antrodiella citrinella]|uniref:Uncharacterized protein n=1 Tax=Antrodiella citrinella TaxID=2447956 RepID=A0A4S4MN17_9APHY|nr:hypothetical protein EUX98_g7511 [Antrodiella citrinella]